MKIIKLTAISAAVLASSAALAAPSVVVDDANTYAAAPIAYNTTTAPTYTYQANNNDAGIIGNTFGAIRNTTGAIFGGTKTLFSTAINPASVSAEVGTLGYGASLGYSLNEKVELQAGWAGGDVAELFGDDFDADDVEFEVDTDFSNPYLGVQIRPMANWFTMGAGVIVPDNDIDVTANANDGFYEIDGVDYDADDLGTLSGNLEHRNELAPYATIGFRPNISKNWGVFGEIGAAYLGKTEATLRSSNDVAGGGNVSAGGNQDGTGLTINQVTQLAENELEDEDYLDWLPIVKLGATYRF